MFYIQRKTTSISLIGLFFVAVCLAFLLAGCGNSGEDYSGDFDREFAAGIKPEIIDVTLIDENGNEVDSRVVDGNRIIEPREGQKIGFAIVFRTSRDVSGAEVIVSQYTPMDLISNPEPVYCEGPECPDPEKGEIAYYGEEIFSGTPYHGPQRYSVPPLPENGEDLKEEDYHVIEEASYDEHYLKKSYYYTIDELGYGRMFRFQVEDSAGYISRHLVLYTKIPL